jgi:4-diphosphocytidyl-2-C-methyl-D-erythritol kinase
MIYFPNAKINLGLHITGKRKDGYHNIETVFYPVGLSDILEVTPAKGDTMGNTLKSTGNPLNIGPADNLCIRAWTELNKIRSLPEVNIHLHKIIPSGAGLGGGSSDAAFVLKALNELFELELSPFQLASVAGIIGSDCPFFIHNTPLFATERGNKFEKIEVDLSDYHIVIIHPGISINTAWAYNGVTVYQHDVSIREIVSSHPSTWQELLINDFEPSVFKAYPMIRKIKEILIENGAVYASMTGSGSAVYGIFEYDIESEILEKEFPGIYLWKGILQ